MRQRMIFALWSSVAPVFAASAAYAAPPLQAAMESCRHAEDAAQKIAACTAIITFSHDNRTLLRAYNTRGLALCDADRCSEAVSDFDHVLQIDPSIPGYFDSRARALRAAGRYTDAVADLDHAIGMAPRCAFLYHTKAETYEEQGRLGDALLASEQELKTRPTTKDRCSGPDAGAWEFRGKILGEMGQYSEAYNSYDRALQMQPDRWDVFRTRAATELAQGRPDAALADLLRYPDNEADAAQVREQIAAIRSGQQAGIDRREEAQRQIDAAREAARQAQRERQLELARQLERDRQIEAQRLEAQRAEAEHRQASDESATRLAILRAQAEKAQAEAELAKAQAARAQADLNRVEADRVATEADLARVRAAVDRDAKRIKADIDIRDGNQQGDQHTER